jgi:hypothetical protein
MLMIWGLDLYPLGSAAKKKRDANRPVRCRMKSAGSVISGVCGKYIRGNGGRRAVG